MRKNFTPQVLVCLLLSLLTLETRAQSPGGIGTANMSLWLKADVIVATDGATITNWNSSVGTYNLTTGTGTKKFYNSSPAFLVNFNPSVYFNGSGHFRNNNRLFFNTSGFTILSVAKDQKSSLSGYRASAGFGNNGNYPALDLADNRWAPWFDFAGGQWNGSASRTYNGSYSGSGQQPQIFGLSANTGASIQSYVDNFTTNTGRIHNQNTQIGNGTFIGSSYDGLWTGTVNEVIVYNRALNAAELLQAQSYLALKWGVTLKNSTNQNTTSNYASSTASVIWDATTNTGYNFNVAGIGRDDASGLNQKQSRSVNTNKNATDPMNNGNMVTIGLGSIAPSNATNLNAFTADQSFMIWGDNGASGLQTTEAPQSMTVYGAAGLTVRRLSREWKVQVTGTVGAVQLQFDLSNAGVAGNAADDFRLLVDPDGDFTNTTTSATAIISPSNWNPTTKLLTFDNVTQLTNGQYFTLTTKAVYSPGGVSNGLVAWYRADDPAISLADAASIAGGSTRPTTGTVVWPNFIGGNGLFSGSGTKNYYSSTAARLVNFNPSFQFNNSGSGLVNGNSYFSNTLGLHIISCARYEGTAGALGASCAMGDNGNDPGLDRQKDGTSPSGWNPWMDGFGEWGSGGTTNASRAILYGSTIHANTGQIPQLFSLSVGASPSTGPIISYIDNFREQTTLTGISRTNIGNGVYAGSSEDAPWTGAVNEIIIHSRTLTSEERLKVNSYMALKYGISLRDSASATATANLINGNNTTASQGINFIASKYMASNSAVIFDPANSVGYTYNIAGIGRDDASALQQKQSRSQNLITTKIISGTVAGALSTEVLDRMWKGNMLTIGKGAIAATNASNINSFGNDLTFTIWADDGKDPNEILNSTDLPAQFTACPGSKRLGREWKAQVTGDIQTNLAVQFDLTNLTGITSTATDQFTLLVDEDGNGNFADGNIRKYKASSFASNIVAFTAVTLNNGEVFTLMTVTIEDGIVFLVPTATTVTTNIVKCTGNNGYRYFYDPVATTPTQKIFALNANGNTIGLNTTPASNNFTTIINTNHSQTELEQSNATAATVLSNRMIQVNTSALPGPFQLNGGVRVRIYYDQAEIDEADERLSQIQAANGIEGNILAGWFKAENTISGVLSGLTPLGLTGTYTMLTPDSSGIEEGVSFVEFWNIQSFSTFGYLVKVPGQLDINGLVWGDGNANGLIDGGEVPISGGADLYVALLNPGTSEVVGVGKVDASTGSYSILGAITASTGPFILRLTNLIPEIGETSPAVGLPTGYVRTAEIIDGTLQLGTPLEIVITTAATSAGTDLVNYDFGIDRLPLTDEKIFNNVPNSAFLPDPNGVNIPGYLGIPMMDPNLQPLSGNDAEDCPASSSCSMGSSFVIESIIEGTRLFYNGVEILGTGLPGDTINNFDPSLMVIYGALGKISAGFTYSLIDAARFVSTTPQPYTINVEFVLPVELVRFEVARHDKDALLTWSTASEQNSNRFEIEQSNDGISFTKIGQVKAAGNSSIEVVYSFTDANILRYNSNILFYRLKQVDNDGQFKYSGTRMIRLDGIATNWRTYPIPFSNMLVIDIPQDLRGITQIKLTDANGRLVYHRQYIINSGQSNIVLSDLNRLMPGTYLLTIGNDDSVKDIKVMKR